MLKTSPIEKELKRHIQENSVQLLLKACISDWAMKWSFLRLWVCLLAPWWSLTQRGLFLTACAVHVRGTVTPREGGAAHKVSLGDRHCGIISEVRWLPEFYCQWHEDSVWVLAKWFKCDDLRQAFWGMTVLGEEGKCDTNLTLLSVLLETLCSDTLLNLSWRLSPFPYAPKHLCQKKVSRISNH